MAEKLQCLSIIDSRIVVKKNRPSGKFLAVLMVAAIAGCTHIKDDYRHAEDLLASGEYEQAVDTIMAHYEASPHDPKLKSFLIQATNLALISLIKAGESALMQGNTEDAKHSFLRALAIDPNSYRAKTGLRSVEQYLQEQEWLDLASNSLHNSDVTTARNLVRKALQQNPENERALQLRNLLRNQGLNDEKPSLLNSTLKKNVSLELRDTPLRDALMLLAQSADINFILDQDLPNDISVTIFVSDARITDTLEFMLQTYGLEKKILNDKTLLIYPATTEKKSRYSDLYTRTFHLAYSSPDTVAELLRGILKSADLHIDNASRSITMRDTAETIEAAERLIEVHDIAPAEVLLDVEIFEVSTDALSNLGVEYPSRIALSVQGQDNKPGILRWSELKELNSDSFSLGVGDPLAVLNLKSTLGTGNILAKPQIRVKNREKANILIGDRVPVITSTLNQTSGFESQSVTYLDVGIKLEVQPEIFLGNEVSIQVMLEVSNIVREIVGDSGLLAYQVGTRTANTTLQLRDGETQILAGLIKNEELNSESKVPGLSSIPGLGRLFTNENNSHKKSELVLLITPRVVRNIKQPTIEDREFYSGTKERFSLQVPQLGKQSSYRQVALPQGLQTELTDSAVNDKIENVIAPLAVSKRPAIQAQLSLMAPPSIDALRAFNTSIALDSRFKEAAIIQLRYDPKLLKADFVLPALDAKQLKYDLDEGIITFNIHGVAQQRPSDVLATVSFKSLDVTSPTVTLLDLTSKEPSDAIKAVQHRLVISPVEVDLTGVEEIGVDSP